MMKPGSTVQQWADRWLDEFRRPGAATQIHYEGSVRRFCKGHGRRELGSVSRLEARSWALSVPRSVSRVIGTMYGDAVRFNQTETNPFTDLSLPAAPAREIVPPTPAELEQLLAATDVLEDYGPEFRRMILVAAWTGIRQGELFALKWSGVGSDTLEIREARKTDGSIGTPKNGRPRTVALPKPARVLNDQARGDDSPYVFHSRTGRPLLKPTFNVAWRAVRAEAGLELRWHDLRHHAATQLIELGLDTWTVSIQLGHTDGGELVRTRYGHPDHARAIGRINEAVGA